MRKEPKFEIEQEQKINDINNSGEINSSFNQSEVINSHNKSIIVNEYIYEEISKEKLKEMRKKEKAARFGLASICGNSVRCIGLLIDNIICDSDGIERSTVINLIDLNTGKYLSDHINIERKSVSHILNKEREISEPINQRVSFVEIYGRVYKYDDGDDRYAVDPKQLKNGYVRSILEDIINPINAIDYTKLYELDCMELSNIQEWLQLDLNTKQLEKLVDYLRKYINLLTQTDLKEDFIYNYVINNYLLNSSQFELYYKELPTNKLNKNHYVELVYLLSNIIIKLSRHDKINVVVLFEEVSKILLSFMGVKPVLKYEETSSFISFNNSLCIGEKVMKYVVNCIMTNFNIHSFDIPYKNDLIKESCYFLKYKVMNRKIN